MSQMLLEWEAVATDITQPVTITSVETSTFLWSFSPCIQGAMHAFTTLFFFF